MSLVCVQLKLQVLPARDLNFQAFFCADHGKNLIGDNCFCVPLPNLVCQDKTALLHALNALYATWRYNNMPLPVEASIRRLKSADLQLRNKSFNWTVILHETYRAMKSVPGDTVRLVQQRFWDIQKTLAGQKKSWSALAASLCRQIKVMHLPSLKVSMPSIYSFQWMKMAIK